ncbi:unnamed protein product [Lactuca virosa]|uniref:Acyl-CoA oxidase C-alpha1 domain-containing protein n=1 Tax=Lactuca virosa TaxID=75947 RepID=A0AAU9LIQ1_9ASTR|nr:unnamed protein product [Lactuca virosa]
MFLLPEVAKRGLSKISEQDSKQPTTVTTSQGLVPGGDNLLLPWYWSCQPLGSPQYTAPMTGHMRSDVSPFRIQFGHHFLKLLVANDFSTLPEAHACTAWLKSLTTTTIVDGIEECRKLCGGHEESENEEEEKGRMVIHAIERAMVLGYYLKKVWFNPGVGDILMGFSLWKAHCCNLSLSYKYHTRSSDCPKIMKSSFLERLVHAAHCLHQSTSKIHNKFIKTTNAMSENDPTFHLTCLQILKQVNIKSAKDRRRPPRPSMTNFRQTPLIGIRARLVSKDYAPKLSWQPSTLVLDRHLLAEDIVYVFLCRYCGFGNILAYWSNCMYLT